MPNSTALGDEDRGLIAESVAFVEAEDESIGADVRFAALGWDENPAGGRPGVTGGWRLTFRDSLPDRDWRIDLARESADDAKAEARLMIAARLAGDSDLSTVSRTSASGNEVGGRGLNRRGHQRGRDRGQHRRGQHPHGHSPAPAGDVGTAATGVSRARHSRPRERERSIRPTPLCGSFCTGADGRTSDHVHRHAVGGCRSR